MSELILIMLDMFDVKILHKYCADTLAKVKILVNHSLQNKRWLVIGICNASIKAVQQPHKQRNSLTLLDMNIVQVVNSSQGNFL